MRTKFELYFIRKKVFNALPVLSYIVPIYTNIKGMVVITHFQAYVSILYKYIEP